MLNYIQSSFLIMRSRLLVTAVCLLLFIALVPPTASANDTMSEASLISPGTTQWYVCWNDECTYGIDQYDYLKFQVYKGDEYKILAENDCPVNYAAASFYTNSGSGWSSGTRLDCSDSATWGWNTAGSNGYRYIYLMGHDDFAGDQNRIDVTLWIDTSGRDQDGDGIKDTLDDCMTSYGDSYIDRDGCPDSDGDGYSDAYDAFDWDDTQWDDYDGDGYGDNPSGLWPDSCMYDEGDSWRDRYGCPDLDEDGSSDPDSGWSVRDGADAFENEPTQWSDEDEDGFGDNQEGGSFQPDSCPRTFGTSFHDRYGCPDFDNDGWSDKGDELPRMPTQHQDSDGDGYGDNNTAGAINPDACPDAYGGSIHDRLGCLDTDGDGWSNPTSGLWRAHPVGLADAFPMEPSQWMDSDGDNYGDNNSIGAYQPDACPQIQGTSHKDVYGCKDSDNDGWSDENDAFDNDPTSWSDQDGDGWADQSSSIMDDCPTTPGTSTIGLQGCPDTDGDGVPDGVDVFPLDATQTVDTDGDGYGDNQEGTNADDCITQAGTSTKDKLGCPDIDGDGYSDSADAFPDDSTNWVDSDGDGFGDQAFGPNRDDCPDEAGTSDLDRRGCVDSNGDGYSDEYGAVNAIANRVGAQPFGEITFYAVPMILFVCSLAASRFLRK